MSFEPAQAGWTGFSRDLKDLAFVMSSEAGAPYHNGTTLNIVEKPHLRINPPKGCGASLEAMLFDDTQAADKNGGVDRYDEGNGQIAHESGFAFAGISSDVGVFGLNVTDKGAVARILPAYGDAPELEKIHISLNGLLTVLDDIQHLGRRH